MEEIDKVTKHAYNVGEEELIKGLGLEGCSIDKISLEPTVDGQEVYMVTTEFFYGSRAKTGNSQTSSQKNFKEDKTKKTFTKKEMVELLANTILRELQQREDVGRPFIDNCENYYIHIFDLFTDHLEGIDSEPISLVPRLEEYRKKIERHHEWFKKKLNDQIKSQLIST